MRAPLPLLLCAILTTTGCSRIAESGLNPLNWFGTSQSTVVDASGQLRPLVPASNGGTFDQRGGIAEVSSVTLERTPEGAILRATGVASTQGQFNAQLVPVSQQNGVLTLAFRVEGSANAASGSASSRRITVARLFTKAELAGIRSFVVQGARNSRSIRR